MITFYHFKPIFYKNDSKTLAKFGDLNPTDLIRDLKEWQLVKYKLKIKIRNIRV